MNIQKKQHNALIIRELLPPPISLCNNHISSNAFRSAIPALLHQAHAFCGRAFRISMFLALLSLGFISCEKDVLRYQEMVQYHTESVHLPQVTTDSVSRFSQKVSTFLAQHPDAQDDPLYPEIQANIRAASFRMTITINDEWDGENVVNF